MVFILTGCYVSKNPMRDEVKRLQKGKVKEDTSYVYGLPYEEGKSHYMVQGYFSSFTHRERAALDFKMKRGYKNLCRKRRSGGKTKGRRRPRWPEKKIQALWQLCHH